MLTGLYFWKQ